MLQSAGKTFATEWDAKHSIHGLGCDEQMLSNHFEVKWVFLNAAGKKHGQHPVLQLVHVHLKKLRKTHGRDSFPQIALDQGDQFSNESR